MAPGVTAVFADDLGGRAICIDVGHCSTDCGGAEPGSVAVPLLGNTRLIMV